MSREVEAADWFAAYQRDPDIVCRVPHRPRLIQELLAAPLASDGILLIGAPARHILRGGHARIIARDLWRLLDGTLTAAELADKIPEHAGAIAQTLALLHRAGLLEEGELPMSGGRSPAESFLGRFAPAAGYHDSRTSALAALAATVCLVQAPERLLDVIRSQFSQLGVECISHAGYDGKTASKPTFGLVIPEDAREGPLASGFREIPVLFGFAGDNAIVVGPYHVPGASACLSCCHRALMSAVSKDDSSGSEFAAGLVAMAALKIICGLDKNPSYFRFRIMERNASPSWSRRDLTIPRMPGCGDCGLAKFEPLNCAGDKFHAWAIFSSSMLPLSSMISPRTHEGHYAPHILEIAKQPDAPAGGAAIVCESPVDRRPLFETSSNLRRGELDFSTLVSCLECAFGFRQEADGKQRKTAPTGGGLRSPEGYVVVREIGGIADGIYRYHAETHTLDVVRSGRLEKNVMAAAFNYDRDGPICIVIGAARVGRLRLKYQSLSQRIAYLDAGVALTYLQEVAWALDVNVQDQPYWQDEFVLELLGLPRASGNYEIAFVEFMTSSLEAAGRNFIELKKFGEGLARLLPSPDAGTQDAQCWLGGKDGSWDRKRSFLADIVLVRRAIRQYGAEPIDRGTCTQLLRRLLERNILLEKNSGLVLPLRAIAINSRGTENFPTGIYQLPEPGGDLQLLKELHDKNEIVSCFNQRTIGSAPLLIIVEVDMAELFRRHSGRTLTRALARAGSLLMHIWLFAISKGLVGCFSGGLLEADFRRLSSGDGYSQCPLFVLAVGCKVS